MFKIMFKLFTVTPLFGNSDCYDLGNGVLPSSIYTGKSGKELFPTLKDFGPGNMYL